MFIERITVESFGSLKDVSYDLKEGVNIFRGRNECGKSTLAAFIKYIFYGLAGNVPDKSMTEQARYTSWDSGISAGSLLINDGGKRYHIDRRTAPDARGTTVETLKVTDLISGTEVFRGKVPGEVFFGVSEEIFSQTAFSAQGSGSVVDAEKMNSAIDNMLFAGNESLNVKEAMKTLSSAAELLLAANGQSGKIFLLDKELEELENRIAKAKENEAFLESKSQSLRESRRQFDDNSRQLKENNDKLLYHEAEAILARFADLDAKKETFRLALAEGTRQKVENTKNTFLPDYEFRDSLKALHADIGIAEKEVASLASQKDAFALTTLAPDQRTVLAAVEKAGGKEKAIAAIKTATAKKAGRKKTATALFVVAFLFAAASVLLGIMGMVPALAEIPYVSYALYGVTALFVVAAIATALSVSSVKAKELYQNYLARDEATALRHIENAANADTAVREENSRYDVICRSYENAKQSLAALFEKANGIMQKWGLTCTDRESVLCASVEAASAIAKLEKAALAIRDAQMIYESAEKALADLSREEALALKEHTAYAVSVKNETPEEIQRKQAFFTKKEEALEKQIRSLELEIASRTAVTENAEELCEELNELEELREEYANEYRALMLAYEAIRKSSDRLRKRIAPALSEAASHLMKESTKGRYSDIAIDDGMTVSFRTKDSNKSHTVGFMSAGTKALTYVSLRLSLIRLFFRDKMPPTVFDEAFSWLDSDRLTSVMALLFAYSHSAQVILMTCCDREYEAAENKERINLIDIRS